MNKVRKAVIPVAGYGTRFLPYTKSVPKPMLPILNVPAIQVIAEEAAKSGIEEIMFVVGQKKEIIETLDRIGIENYPEFYDPFAEHKSLDKQDVILYVSYNGKTKLIKCFDVPPFTEPAADEKGADFISLCDMLINTVTSAGKTDG